VRGLSDWATDNGVRLSTIPPECEQSYHMFYLILLSLDRRQGLIWHLSQRVGQGRLSPSKAWPSHVVSRNISSGQHTSPIIQPSTRCTNSVEESPGQDITFISGFSPDNEMKRAHLTRRSNAN